MDKARDATATERVAPQCGVEEAAEDALVDHHPATGDDWRAAERRSLRALEVTTEKQQRQR